MHDSTPTHVAATEPLTSGDVWDRLGGQLRAFIARRLADPDAVDDVLQDVFLRLHVRLDTLRDHERVTPWVYRIARNAVVDHHRARAGAAIPLADVDDARDGQHATGDRSAALRTLTAAGGDDRDADADRAAERHIAAYLGELIDCLPETYRQAVRLAEIDGLTQAEVGTRLGLSLSGAKSRVQRGRAMLRAQILECCHIELDRRGRVIDYHPRGTCCRRCGCGGG